MNAPTTEVDDAAIPPIEEIARLLPDDRSIVRRRASDPRMLLGAGGYAIGLQIGHPTIAAGVAQHSDYGADPWGRAFRTADYLNLLCYGDAATVRRVAVGLRASHRPIRGVDDKGRRYSALEPTAYAWVHATIGAGMVKGHDVLGTPFTPAGRQEFLDQWLRLGDVVGVRRGILPETWPDFVTYLDDTVRDVLEPSAASHDLLVASRRATGGSPMRWLPDFAFGVVGVPLGNVLRFVGAGLLPDDMRRRFGVPWSARHQRAFDAYAVASRAAGPALPRRVRQAGPGILRARRHESGPFGRRNIEFLRGAKLPM